METLIKAECGVDVKETVVFFEGGGLTDHMRYGCIVCKYAYTNIGVYIYICTYMQEQSYNIYVCHIVLCDLYVTSNKYDY